MPTAWVLGLAKDCARKLEQNVDSINAFLDGWHVQWAILESNSSDNTPSTLVRIREHTPEMVVLGEPDEVKPWMSRPEQMAVRRNSLLDYMRNHGAPPQAILVADLDIELRLRTHMDNYAPGIEAKEVAFSHQRPYYDVWALRYKGQPGDCYRKIEKRLSCGENPFSVYESEVFRHQRKLGKLRERLEVESAFGGFAVYPNFSQLPITYSSSEGCEHVALNQELKKSGFSMFIDPSLQTGPAKEHSRFAKFPYWTIIMIATFLPSSAAGKIFLLLSQRFDKGKP